MKPRIPILNCYVGRTNLTANALPQGIITIHDQDLVLFHSFCRTKLTPNVSTQRGEERGGVRDMTFVIGNGIKGIVNNVSFAEIVSINIMNVGNLGANRFDLLVHIGYNLGRNTCNIAVIRQAHYKASWSICRIAAQCGCKFLLHMLHDRNPCFSGIIRMTNCVLKAHNYNISTVFVIAENAVRIKQHLLNLIIRRKGQIQNNVISVRPIIQVLVNRIGGKGCRDTNTFFVYMLGLMDIGMYGIDQCTKLRIGSVEDVVKCRKDTMIELFCKSVNINAFATIDHQIERILFGHNTQLQRHFRAAVEKPFDLAIP